MIFGKGSGFVWIIVVVFSHVGNKGSKIEKLKGAQEGRNNPENDQIGLWNEELQYIKGNRCQNDLFD